MLSNVNTAATPEAYYGNYAGTVTFRNENVEIMGELYGDAEEAAILSSINGKTYNCTAVLDEDYLDMYSMEVPTEMLDSDGSFFYIYYDIENGASLYEDSGYDDELMATYSMKENAYFLNDGSIYVINSVTAQFDDGRFIASEMRFILTPSA